MNNNDSITQIIIKYKSNPNAEKNYKYITDKMREFYNVLIKNPNDSLQYDIFRKMVLNFTMLLNGYGSHDCGKQYLDFHANMELISFYKSYGDIYNESGYNYENILKNLISFNEYFELILDNIKYFYKLNSNNENFQKLIQISKDIYKYIFEQPEIQKNMGLIKLYPVHNKYDNSLIKTDMLSNNNISFEEDPKFLFHQIDLFEELDRFDNDNIKYASFLRKIIFLLSNNPSDFQSHTFPNLYDDSILSDTIIDKNNEKIKKRSYLYGGCPDDEDKNKKTNYKIIEKESIEMIIDNPLYYIFPFYCIELGLNYTKNRYEKIAKFCDKKSKNNIENILFRYNTTPEEKNKINNRRKEVLLMIKNITLKIKSKINSFINHEIFDDCDIMNYLKGENNNA